jgi:hypothetical protein
MRTTLDIDERTLERVVEITCEKSTSKAVQKALDEFIRRKAIDELRAMAGKMPIDDLSKEQREADLTRQRFLDQLWGYNDGDR